MRIHLGDGAAFAASLSSRVTASTTPFLRVQDMMALMNMSRSTLYRKVKDEKGFPQPVPFGTNARRWKRDEVTAYLSGKLGFDASQLVSECLRQVREQMRERSKPRSVKVA